MPELPDVTIYLEALERRVIGQPLQRVRLASPFLLRTATPPIESVNRRRVLALRRVGKRVCFGCEGDLWLVLHRMMTGQRRRRNWKTCTKRIRL